MVKKLWLKQKYLGFSDHFLCILGRYFNWLRIIKFDSMFNTKLLFFLGHPTPALLETKLEIKSRGTI